MPSIKQPKLLIFAVVIGCFLMYDIPGVLNTFNQYNNRTPNPRSQNLSLYNKTTEAENNSSLERFYMHIPKTGGWYVFEKMRSFEEGYKRNKGQPRICNLGKSGFEKKSEGCVFSFSELKYSKYPNHTYTMIRKPSEHVLSQYFHCTESTDHRNRARYMPSLDEWLEAWTLALHNDTKAKENGIFQCYDPRNLQHSYTFHELRESESIDIETMKNRYAVIAPFERINTAICVMYIHFAGHVPDKCICAEHTNGRRRTFDVTHGVKHHGSTFNISSDQKAMIEKLTEDDRLLHIRTVELFEEKLQEIETKYEVKIC